MQTNSQRTTKLAHWLDDRFTIPGTDIRFGLDPIISIIPGAGDWLSGLISSYFVVIGVKADVPKSILLRMGTNILLDILIGSIPLLGDIFDFSWKANTRNAKLLEKYRIDSASTERQSKILLWAIALIIFLAIIALLILIGWAIAAIIGLIF